VGLESFSPDPNTCNILPLLQPSTASIHHLDITIPKVKR
jgi:hypothetical protein